ncbi:hypothetical protein J2128_001407 [Methanomicrobium sp. W14]|uniref:hypothetical protein n=1 Tax=Methanomicrobium sp. W14 TaxID=2817839 RepID=UPI001AE44096|nr:hypothetical protein [Methanomicrobium sp. W14]MBP2133453.1 hypothetical protein [Methanomicrobium sp. W14]
MGHFNLCIKDGLLKPMSLSDVMEREECELFTSSHSADEVIRSCGNNMVSFISERDEAD